MRSHREIEQIAPTLLVIVNVRTSLMRDCFEIGAS